MVYLDPQECLVGLEQEVSQVIQDIQDQQVTQAFQDLGFLETQVQKEIKDLQEAGGHQVVKERLEIQAELET